MPRYFLKLSFNGKAFHGWQVQDNAHSVQAELNTALTTLLKQPIETMGCGRTDTGVHAKMFFAHFDCNEAIEHEKDFRFHLNCLLPLDVSILEVIPVAADAHARYDATWRTYQYYTHSFKNPFLNDTSYYFPFPVDIDLMNKAAELLFTHSDFSCFSKSNTQVKTNICKIASAKWTKVEDQLVFEITADRFLRNMVRAIVGTLLEVGEKRITIDDFKKVLEAGNRSHAGMSVPGHALFLVDVRYPYINP